MDKVDRHGADDAVNPTGAGARLDESSGGQIWGDDWVHELIAMTRPGVEIQFPVRRIDEREVPFVYDDFR